MRELINRTTTFVRVGSIIAEPGRPSGMVRPSQAGLSEGTGAMGTRVRRLPRLGVTIAGAAFIAAGAAFIAAGVAVVGASTQAVSTSAAYGYYPPPTAYNLGDSATFSYVVTNLTGSTISATLAFNTARITSFEGIDVSTGDPALTQTEIAQNWWNTVQVYDIPNQYQDGFSLPPLGSETVTFTTEPLTQCGYYQLDSEATGDSASGLFATGFIRVVGCTSPPTGTPGPSPTPTGGGSPTPTSTVSPTPTPTSTVSATPTPTGTVSRTPRPTGSVLPTATSSGSGSGSPTPSASEPVVTASPAGGVLAASTPGTGVGPAVGSGAGIAVIVVGILLVIAVIVGRRHPRPI
jgi:hypothetical protein